MLGLVIVYAGAAGGIGPFIAVVGGAIAVINGGFSFRVGVAMVCVRFFYENIFNIFLCFLW